MKKEDIKVGVLVREHDKRRPKMKYITEVFPEYLYACLGSKKQVTFYRLCRRYNVVREEVPSGQAETASSTTVVPTGA